MIAIKGMGEYCFNRQKSARSIALKLFIWSDYWPHTEMHREY